MTFPTFDHHHHRHHAGAAAPAPAPAAAPAFIDHTAIDAWLAANLQLAPADTTTPAAAAKFPLASTDAEWAIKADQGASNDELALAFGLGMDPQFALSGLFLDELGLGTAQFGATSSAAASKAGSPGLDDLPVLVPASPKPVAEQVVEVPSRTTPALTIPAELSATTTAAAATSRPATARPALRPLAPRPLAPRPPAPVQAPAAVTAAPASTAPPTSPVHPNAYPMVAIPIPAAPAAAAPTQYPTVPAMTTPESAPVMYRFLPQSTEEVPAGIPQPGLTILSAAASKAGSPGLDDLPVLVPASPKPVAEQVVEVPSRTTPSLTIPAELPATTTAAAATARPALRPLAPRPARAAARPAPVQAPCCRDCCSPRRPAPAGRSPGAPETRTPMVANPRSRAAPAAGRAERSTSAVPGP
ncbi:hypothetical protein AMAG_20562 [Allomyces macrogynus ATCC 38327]|uniref:Uncharacterized protein n=1 Tax=Allomyces macrogynus (strain ATCC 38327) TaxID=578462 RepID=A0A0L0TCM8_ALLM3|nr:hypothetical protein AMAG_20562 [Allomyces macrogynus ATCC 38327]|eukprot:KNE72294.1 hypothetical protein AMAG_20562 [Allomyces macrogynus ATCC 38327]